MYLRHCIQIAIWTLKPNTIKVQHLHLYIQPNNCYIKEYRHIQTTNVHVISDP
jgi:hypothetical protein